MGTLGVHQNIPASDTKLTSCLGIDYISPPLVMVTFIPDNGGVYLKIYFVIISPVVL